MTTEGRKAERCRGAAVGAWWAPGGAVTLFMSCEMIGAASPRSLTPVAFFNTFYSFNGGVLAEAEDV